MIKIVAPKKTIVSSHARWEALCKRFAGCRRCAHHKSCSNQVRPYGSPRAAVAIVGSYPSRDEDATGTPLMGDGGALCMRVVRQLGLEPKRDIYATTLVKCAGPWEVRDGKNRRAYPTDDATAECRKLLDAELSIVKPAVLVLHGKLASQVVLGDNRPFGQFCGHIRSAGLNCIAVSTHNPYGLTFGDRIKLQAEYLGHWEEIGVRLSCLGRLWRPDAELFQAGWTYENRGKL